MGNAFSGYFFSTGDRIGEAFACETLPDPIA